MSVSSEYKDRFKQRRRDDARTVMLVVRSLISCGVIVAVGLMFDVPQKIRGKWLQNPQASVSEQPTHASSDSARDTSLERQSANMPLSQRDPRSQSGESNQLGSQSHSTLRPQNQELVQANVRFRERAELPSDSVLPDGSSTQDSQPAFPRTKTGETIIDSKLVTLDLNSKQQRIPLVDGGASAKTKYPTVRIIGLKNLETPHKITPVEARISKDGEALIHFTDIPNARIRVTVVRVGARIVLAIEPQMSLWADEPMPLMLKKIKKEALVTKQNANQFMQSSLDLSEEKASLEAWSSALVVKTVEARGQARLRVKRLAVELKQRESRVPGVQKEVQIVNDLEALALRLHKKAQLEYVVVD